MHVSTKRMCVCAHAQIMWCFISIIGAAMAQPHNPHQGNPKLVVARQQFAWTEAGLEEAIKVSQQQQQQHCTIVITVPALVARQQFAWTEAVLVGAVKVRGAKQQQQQQQQQLLQ
jgi:hypothetical protein